MASEHATLPPAAYAERRFADLPILADALEEAGCTSADLLAHLRSGGDHVLGRWESRGFANFPPKPVCSR